MTTSSDMKAREGALQLLKAPRHPDAQDAPVLPDGSVIGETRRGASATRIRQHLPHEELAADARAIQKDPPQACRLAAAVFINILDEARVASTAIRRSAASMTNTPRE